MSDFYEITAEHRAALNRAELLRDMRIAQERNDRRRIVIVDVLTLVGYVSAIVALAALSMWWKR